MFSHSILDGSSKNPYFCFSSFQYFLVSYVALFSQRVSCTFDQANYFAFFFFLFRCADLLNLLLFLVLIHGLLGQWDSDGSCCWRYLWKLTRNWCSCSAPESFSHHSFIQSVQMWFAGCLAACVMFDL